jgi:phosphatidylethanolamine-binding protein (PEBP) family uncharacterized protein
LNDYTGWFAGDADMQRPVARLRRPVSAGQRPALHRYFFRLFALRVPTLDVPEDFTAADVFHALQPHEITEAAIYGTYSLNPQVKA